MYCDSLSTAKQIRSPSESVVVYRLMSNPQIMSELGKSAKISLIRPIRVLSSYTSTTNLS